MCSNDLVAIRESRGDGTLLRCHRCHAETGSHAEIGCPCVESKKDPLAVPGMYHMTQACSFLGERSISLSIFVSLAFGLLRAGRYITPDVINTHLGRYQAGERYGDNADIDLV